MSQTEEIKAIRARLHLVENSNTGIQIQLDNHHESLNILKVSIQNKVAWKHLVWIVGVIFMFMASILGAIYVQVRDNGSLGQENRSAISRIEGVLTTADVTQ